jgi:hypothetical protein
VGGFGAEPGQLQQHTEKVPEKDWEALVQSQVRDKKVPEKGGQALVQSRVWFKIIPGGFGAGPNQIQQVPEEVPEKA